VSVKVLVIVGTRPEAIKMAPVVAALKARPETYDCRLCVTAQHREMLDQVLAMFDLVPDHDLDLMRPNQGLAELTAAAITGVASVLRKDRPDVVLVHGDTTTTLAASIAAFYEHVPVGHVEAGLRTHDLTRPFPEEANRVLTDHLVRFRFAPTARARQHLMSEGILDCVWVTGNTVIDALLSVVRRVRAEPPAVPGLPPLDPSRRLVLVTGHRRESFGEGFLQIGRALRTLATSRDDIEIVYPVHLNPNVQRPVRELLAGLERVHLIEPLPYLPFVSLLDRCHLVLTDSGGIQEEAPALGKPVLVMRDVTERPEAVEAGTARLVGAREEDIVRAVEELLDSPGAYAAMAHAENPFGDGRAAERIADVLAEAVRVARTMP
jgi:UDP-N-acetylglucosamine 2-epimerase